MSESVISMSQQEVAVAATLVGKSELDFDSVIQGSSMADTLPDGARIRIRARQDKDYRCGEIVACVQRTGLFAHRIVYRNLRNETFITRGDGRWLCDEPIPSAIIVGAVEAVRIGEAWEVPRSSRSAGLRRLGEGAALALIRLALIAGPKCGRLAAVALLRLAQLSDRRTIAKA